MGFIIVAPPVTAEQPEAVTVSSGRRDAHATYVLCKRFGIAGGDCCGRAATPRRRRGNPRLASRAAWHPLWSAQARRPSSSLPSSLSAEFAALSHMARAACTMRWPAGIRESLAKSDGADFCFEGTSHVLRAACRIACPLATWPLMHDPLVSCSFLLPFPAAMRLFTQLHAKLVAETVIPPYLLCPFVTPPAGATSGEAAGKAGDSDGPRRLRVWRRILGRLTSLYGEGGRLALGERCTLRITLCVRPPSVQLARVERRSGLRLRAVRGGSR